MSDMYKGFKIKSVVTNGSAPRYIGTLQGLRFTGTTLTGLKDKIDRNSLLAIEMRMQSFAKRADTGLVFEDDMLVSPAEVQSIVSQLTGYQAGAY